MRSIIKYFVENPILVSLALAIIVLTGVWQLSQIRSTSTPPTAVRSLSVRVIYPGASPQEVEEGVVEKVEENLLGIQAIKRYTSESQENMAVVTIQLKEGADADEALNEVKNAVDKINTFPSGIEEPVIEKIEPLSPVLSMVLVGDVTLQALKDYAEDMKDDLIANDGLSEVRIYGYPAEEIEVNVRENDLRAYHLTFDAIANAVRQANLNTTGGEIKTEGQNIQIRANAKSYYAKDLRNIIVRAQADGQVTYLKDVASVRERFADAPTQRRYEGNPSVYIDVLSRNEENVLDLSEIVHAYVQDFNQTHADIRCEILIDQTVNLVATQRSMFANVLVGLLLVLIVLGLFLERHLAFWVALKIPVSLLGMFALSSLFDLTINMVSLFGCILVLGILVDDGVVIAENIYQHFTEKKKDPAPAALDGTREMILPVFFSLMTTATAFSLFFFLPGQVGDFFSTVSFVVCTTLLVAMIESFFLLPAHLSHSRALRQDNKQSRIERKFNDSLLWLRNRVYMPVVRFAVGPLKWVVVVASVVFLVLSLLILQAGWVKTTFFPSLNNDVIVAALELEPGTSEQVTLNKLKQIEQAVGQVGATLAEAREDGQDVIQHVELSVGPDAHKGTVRVVMLGGEERGMRAEAVSELIRQEAGTIPGAVNLTYTGEGGRLGGKPVSISLYSEDTEVLRTVKNELKRNLEQRGDLKDVVDTDETGVPEITIELKPQAEYLGLSLQQVISQVRAGFFGVEAQSLQRGDEQIKVWVRYGNEGRESIADLRNMLIRVPGNSTQGGQAYPLENIATLREDEGVVAIHHFNGRREIRVEADVANGKVSALEVVNEVQTEVLPGILAEHPSVSYSLEGQNQESAEIIEAMANVAPLIGLAMLTLVIINFKSLSQTVIVLLTLPFVLPGVVIGHAIHGLNMSVFSMIGMIALIGVIINNSLVLVSSFNQDIKNGMSFFDALLSTAQSRFRPILLTTVTTVVGLAPMIGSQSITAAFLVPPAVSIAYGLGLGLYIPLVLLPTLLVFTSQLKMLWHRLWEGERAQREALEPAARSLKHKIS